MLQAPSESALIDLFPEKELLMTSLVAREKKKGDPEKFSKLFK